MSMIVTVGTLALLWVLMGGDASPASIVTGVVVGLGIAVICRREPESAKLQVRLHRVPGFVAFYLWELLRSNLRVARFVLGNPNRLRPACVAVPLEDGSVAVSVVVANLVSLTPGSLSVELAGDGRTLFVHVMHTEDPELARDEIRSMERRVREVFA